MYLHACNLHFRAYSVYESHQKFVSVKIQLNLPNAIRPRQRNDFSPHSFQIDPNISHNVHHGKCKARRKDPQWRTPQVGEKRKTGIWRLYNIEVSVEEDPGKDHYDMSDALLQALASFLDCPVASLPRSAFSIVRKSFDARRCLADPRFVYVVDVDVSEGQKTCPNLWSILSDLHIRPGKVVYVPCKTEAEDAIALVKKLRTAHSGCESESKDQFEADLMQPMAEEAYHKAISRSLAGNAVPLAKSAQIVVVGCGPAGLFAALVLAECGASVSLIERGQPVECRGRDIGALVVRHLLQRDSNFCFGEGGAGTWSDGKLTTRIGRNSENVQTVLATLVRFGAPPHTLIDGKPHIGTDRLVHILRKFRSHLQFLGVNIMFGTKMVDLAVRNNQTVGVTVATVGRSLGANEYMLESDAVVLAVGHSAHDVYDRLYAHGVLMTPKDFAVGFRVEHPQELINEIQYKKWAAEVQSGRGRVPVADYRVTTSVKASLISNIQPLNMMHHGCYSFCMCPGGQIVPTSTDPLELCINGMSFSKRSSKWANAALVIAISCAEFEQFSATYGPLAGIAFQRVLERKAAVLGGGNMVVPVQTVPDFLENRLSGRPLPSSSYRLGVKEATLHQLFPKHLTEVLKQALVDFNHQIPGFIDQRALLHAVETRTSSPLRIDRNGETYESLSMPGLYPVGEGAGYAGGIVSAGVDGLQAGFAIAKRLGLL